MPSNVPDPAEKQEVGVDLLPEHSKTQRNSNKKWHKAFNAIRSKNALRRRRPPHHAIDIGHDQDHHDQDFEIDPATLNDIVKYKNQENLEVYGGPDGLVKALRTDKNVGINESDSDIQRRRSLFGSNSYMRPPSKISRIKFVVKAFKEITILIFLGYAIVSFWLVMREYEEKKLLSGISIVVAFFFVVAAFVYSNFRKINRFNKLSELSSNIKMDVVRNQSHQEISIVDIVVGDIVCLKRGDQVPADGVFIEGNSMRVEESSMPGESHYVDVDLEGNIFLVSGSRIAEGSGKMMVTSVGINTAWGERISSDTNGRTPLQTRLDEFSSRNEKVGLLVGFVVLVVLLVRYFTGSIEEGSKYDFTGERYGFVTIVVLMVADAFGIFVVSISEGFPVAVILTLAYSFMWKMKDHANVRGLSFSNTMGDTVVQIVRVVATVIFVVLELPSAVILFVAHALMEITENQVMAEKVFVFDTMGSATTICTNKTGTLTSNEMKVTKFCWGLGSGKYSSASRIVLELFRQGVALNTTESVLRAEPGSNYEFSGSLTEEAILSWAVEELKIDMEKVKGGHEVVHVEEFNSERNTRGVLLKKEGEVKSVVHWKGDAGKIFGMCSKFYDGSGVLQDIYEDDKRKFEEITKSMADESLRCMAFAYSEEDDGEMALTLKEENLILLGIVGIQDPCRPGVKEAVEVCQSAGVDIKMITKDDIFTATAVAIECGILPGKDEMINETVLDAEVFRNYSQEQRLEKVERIKVMARSSPSDKLLVLQCLKELNHVVAVIGEVRSDATTLREADVGLSMGIRGTKEAKENSHMVILDDDFASVAKVLQWGRCVCNNMQKFIQFHLTANLAAIVINFLAVVSVIDVPLTVPQLVWVNMVMDMLSAVALATEKPTDDLMEKKPTGRTSPLITNIMWRNLLAQAFYQISVLSMLLFAGKSIFKVSEEDNNIMIFNTYVLCQVFNEFNARSLEKKNVFGGIHKNKLFIGIIVLTMFLQILMVEFLNKSDEDDSKGLSFSEWGICILIGSGSLPIGWLTKWVPVPANKNATEKEKENEIMKRLMFLTKWVADAAQN